MPYKFLECNDLTWTYLASDEGHEVLEEGGLVELEGFTGQEEQTRVLLEARVHVLPEGHSSWVRLM